MNRQQVWKVVGVILLVCGLQLHCQQTASGEEAAAKAATYAVFDPTGSVYTQPQAINPAGAITGLYQQVYGLTTPRGFLRPPNAPNGTSIRFDYSPTNQGTSVSAINPAGTITGNYTDANGTHGFLRIPAHQGGSD